MESTFRKSMAWLHTWSGVTIGLLLFAIFWMGTLSVFDREIDRWMMPATRLVAPATPLSLDATIRPVAEQLAGKSSQWQFVLPTDRVPMLRLTWRGAKDKNENAYLDPATGAVLPEPGTEAGSGFIYPFHIRLHIRWMDLGVWLAGLAAMCMLVAVVSGVVIHKKIFVEFFNFRPKKQTQRAALDLHNLTGVLALPFHFIIALSGLMIMFATYFPSGWQSSYADKKAFNDDLNQIYKRAKAKTPAPLASLDGIVLAAQAQWGSGQPSLVRVFHPGDANAYVEVRRSYDDRITMDGQTLVFDGVSGALLARTDMPPVQSFSRFIQGLHRIQFSHWTLRWLYFVGGLSGCVLIATGFIFWLESRRAQHAKKGLHGVRVVEALAVGSVCGIVLATLVFFVANRLLPLEARWAGADRALLEMWAFFAAWLLSTLHAAWRGRDAWRRQTRAIAAWALLAVALNWATTGDHLLATLWRGQWAVAGMDSLLLLGAAVAVYAARKLQARAVTRQHQPVGTAAHRGQQHA
jgi:uncharacterized iron-regulated membrane protein